MTIPCTAVVITHQFDKQCKRALNSLRDFKEVLVFDNASGIQQSDLSLPQLKIVPLPSTPISDFAKIRNRALAKATFEWVFFLDSDEVLQPFAAKNLTQTLTSTNARGIECTRSDFFLGKQLLYGEAGAQKIVRLLHKNHATFVSAIHEIAKIDGPIHSSDLVIHHFSHASISAFIADVTKYASLIGAQKKFSLFELLFYPPAKFVMQFVLKAGFLDGHRGLVYALIMSIHSITVRATAYEKNQV